jgi:hypothetical protein
MAPHYIDGRRDRSMKWPTLLAIFLGTAPVHADVVVDGGGSFVTLFGVNATASGVVFDAREPQLLCGATYDVERLGGDPALLALIRDGGHPCRGKITIRTTVRFSYEELGLEIGERFQVLNSIEANVLPPRSRR